MKELPHLPTQSVSIEDQMSEYTQARVTLWLDANGWPQVSPIFEEKGICGKRFFSLTMTELHELGSSGLQLSYGEKRKLLYNIKAILPNETTNISTENTAVAGQYQPRSSPTTTRQPYNEFETVRSNSSPELQTPPHDIYGLSASQPYRPRPVNHKLNTTFPPTITSGQTASSPRQYGPRPFARADSADPDFNRIKDYIPERTTSTPQHIHHFLEKMNYSLPQRRVPDTIERAAARNLQHLLGGSTHYMMENNSNATFVNPEDRSTNHFIAGNHATPADWIDRLKYRQQRRPPAQPEKSLERRIQVTADADTWFSLTVTDLQDPSPIKDAILARLNINPHDGPFEYIHENGPYPDSPLGDAELMHLCRVADRSASNRILVRAVDPHAPAEIIASPVGGQFAIGGGDLWAISPSSPSGGHTRTNSDSQPTTLKTPTSAPTSLWAIQPKKSASTSLWATPPPSEPSSLGTRNGSGDSQWPTDAQTTLNKPISLWATPPSSSYSEKRAEDELFSASATASSAINGNGMIANGTEKSSALEAAVESLSLKSPRNDKKLQIQIPSIVANSTAEAEASTSDYSPRQSPFLGSATPNRQARQSSSSESSATAYDTSKPDRLDGHLKPPPQNQNEFWGERPPLEVIAQNPDKYFDEQNLDRELIVDAPSPPTSANNRRPGANLVSRKSVRIKIQETSARNRWHQAHNIIRANNILRRQSTKLWGQKVVQVKPGMTIDQPAPIPVKDEKTEVTNLPAPTKIMYMMGKLIGKGSFGRVYHAVNLNTDPVEVIAVKQVEIPTTKSDLLNEHQRASIEALYHEISLLEGLDHENIVQYLGYDSDEAEGHLNIFLEYVAGGSVSSCLTKFGPFKEPLVSHFTRQILQGLKYLHNKHILHRDIKGGNILVQEDGTCKISDFGLSKLNDQDEVYDQNSKMSLQGSIFWMAPEVVKNQPYSAKVDIWSLGCTVIEMFTGKRPWLDLTALAAVYSLGTCKSPPIPEDISEDAKDFLRQCFIIDPAMRPTATILLRHPFCRTDPNFVFQNYIGTDSSESANR